MSDLLPYILVLHTVLILVLAVMVFGLTRQIGILHERLAPMGAMTNDHGPEVGEMAPTLRVMSIANEAVQIGGASDKGRTTLLMFVSPTCPVCKKLLPIAKSFSDRENLEVILVGDGDAECPAPQSYEFWHALKAQGTPTELVVYPGEGHMFRSADHKRDLMERTVKWLTEYLH